MSPFDSSFAFPPFGAASRRSPVYARNAMAAASHPAAVEAGLGMLDRGGTAADAAVAMAAVLAVVEPCSTGLGGDAFVLYHDAASRRVTGLNGSGRSPQALDFDTLASRTGGALPPRHALAVTVPGACAAWCDLLERHGVLPLAEVLAPALEYAAEGFVVGPVTAHLWAEGADALRAAGGEELLPGGEAPRPGQPVTSPGMARVLDILSGAGGTEAARRAFYAGEIAADIVTAVRERGGVLDASDLAAHRSQWAAPITTMYRGLRVSECAPNGQGITALMALDVLSALDAPTFGDGFGPARVHAQVEALRLAFADSRRYVADPDHEDVPVRGLLDADYAAQRARQVLPGRRNPDIVHGTPPASSDTVYFCVMDAFGNACSMVNSCYMTFGTGIVPRNTGFALQNRGHNFSLDPASPNRLGPGRRTYHTIIPGMLHDRRGTLLGPFGVMGGFMQPQGHVQILSALADDGCDPQAALDRTRFCITDGTPGGELAVEEGMPEAIRVALADMGHPVRMVGGYDRALFGRGQIILRDPHTGWLTAGSDPRADGCAFGY
ncbi:gamma-glutamyltranspeptidase/glutathione hydrolase [Desulfobaculum xiamenense]|uniref:Gamma-glutamyltranspeptidase/glutathione hydrolase n=1 Tax=Desulfobaculum xiamenense TaxID=995050 RepID=A0A846QNU4_9BACT|nr:gamma-glutamyltransferase family protein [Desulfobaculum xiamenense]NJB68857.1 gamma-glutamyltranspeptidase/glutathione hydrolase [Desulfobaculum xiamenense]